MKGDNVEKVRQAQEQKIEQTAIFTKGLRSMLENLLHKSDIDTAKKMFSCNRDNALEIISQYNPAKHRINDRKNKEIKEGDDYETCKLTDASQRRINQISSHFMFANPIKLSLQNDPEEAAQLSKYFKIFKKFLKSHYFDERLYEAREITGSETECAKVYSLVTDEDGNSEIICQLRYNSRGDILYPMFNQYGKMVAFAIGYFLRDEELRSEEHFDVYTSKDIWQFRKPNTSSIKKWELYDKKKNPFNKIPIIYYNHEEDWIGAQSRIERLEWISSKNGDINEYFADPYLLISPDIAENRLAGAKEVGKVILLEEKGRFEFCAPPKSNGEIKEEKDSLNAGIERDTNTPDWTFKNIMGMGSLSSKAMRQQNMSGYVKRDRLANKHYNELIHRELNLITAILVNQVYADKSEIAKGIKALDLGFSYTDPFVGSLDDNSNEISLLRGAHAMSIHTAVQANYYVEDKDAEEMRIWDDIKRMETIKAEATAKASQQNNTDDANDGEDDERKTKKTEE